MGPGRGKEELMERGEAGGLGGGGAAEGREHALGARLRSPTPPPAVTPRHNPRTARPVLAMLVTHIRARAGTSLHLAQLAVS